MLAICISGRNALTRDRMEEGGIGIMFGLVISITNFGAAGEGGVGMHAMVRAVFWHMEI